MLGGQLLFYDQLAGNDASMCDAKSTRSECICRRFSRSWEMISAQTKEILINERCIECKYRPICNTCAAAALLETGDYEGIPEYICEYTKEFYKIMKERR